MDQIEKAERTGDALIQSAKLEMQHEFYNQAGTEGGAAKEDWEREYSEKFNEAIKNNPGIISELGTDRETALQTLKKILYGDKSEEGNQ